MGRNHPHLPGFSIAERKLCDPKHPALGFKRIPVMQGWAKPADAKRALKALQAAHPTRNIYMED